MKKGEVRKVFSKFWCNNIKKNYKKISISIGTFLTVVISAIIRYVCYLVENTGIELHLASTLLAILVGFEALTVGVTILIFGKAQNGNGYDVPPNKVFVKLYRKDKSFREYTKNKLIDLAENGGYEPHVDMPNDSNES